jgi:FSR family fosmidomycin resistance protein-like MFS transporter
MQALPLFLLVAGHIVVDATQNILPVLLPLAKVTFGLSYTQVGLVAALLSLTSSLTQPVFGWLADRWRTDWLLPAGVAWTALFMGTTGIAPSYPFLLLAVGLAGLGTAAYHPKASVGVAAVAGIRKGAAMSLFSAGGNLGFAIGPLLGAFLLRRFAAPGTLGLLVPGALLSAALLAVRAPPVSSPQSPREERGSEGAVPVLGIALLCLAVSLRSWTYQGTIIFLPFLLASGRQPAVAPSVALFLYLFSGALAGLLGGILSDRWGRRRILVGTLLLYAPLMLAFQATDGRLAVLLLALSGAVLLASFPVAIVYAQELLPARIGLASGLTLGFAFGAGGIGAGVTGVLIDAVGMEWGMASLSLLPLGAALACLPLRERRGPAPAPA